MPLQQLVEYFNDRLEQEHSHGFRPFQLQDGAVSGLFGPIRLGSVLAPVRETLGTSHVVGHIAQLNIAANPIQPLQSGELDNLLNDPLAINPGCGNDSIINFDRLSRTVHMLNYLPQSHLDEVLFLDVDPRHILGIKEDHGAYFEEIIVKCGLQTNNVAIGLTLNSAYARFFPSLLKGLQNYQHRGYRLALKLDAHTLDKATFELVSKTAPDYVGLNAQGLDQVKDNQLLTKIQQLNALVASIEGRSVLLNIDDKRSAALARKTGFTLVQGDYFEQPITSANRFEQHLLSRKPSAAERPYLL